jgi:LmbE family N-acetylglucosaminyl deacetylase
MTAGRKNQGKVKYLFICAHPDDLAFSCANLLHHLAQNGRDIEILSLTTGEFGIYEDQWKGPRLARIRRQELLRAAEVHGVASSKVHFASIVDGFVQFDREHLALLLQWINKIQPDIIFVPEPFFTYYWHADHINAGRLSHYLYTRTPHQFSHPVRALYFYTTFKSTFRWPFSSLEQSLQALLPHQSQMWLLQKAISLYPLEKRNWRMWAPKSRKYVERYRRSYRTQPPPHPSFIQRIILILIHRSNAITMSKSHYTVSDVSSPFGILITTLRKKYGYDL